MINAFKSLGNSISTGLRNALESREAREARQTREEDRVANRDGLPLEVRVTNLLEPIFSRPVISLIVGFAMPTIPRGVMTAIRLGQPSHTQADQQSTTTILPGTVARRSQVTQCTTLENLFEVQK